jgi:hypothetical protein
MNPSDGAHALAAKIRREVGTVRLVAAIHTIMVDRGHLPPADVFHVPNPVDPWIDGFMATCSTRQLKLLRQLALMVELHVEPLH